MGRHVVRKQRRTYGVLADGTAQAIGVCAATLRYTRSTAQAAPRQAEEGRWPAKAGSGLAAGLA